MVELKELVKKMYLEGIIEFGEFILSSRRKSNYYIDLRKCLSKPDLYLPIVKLYVDLISTVEFDVIVGVATGGIPWASMVAYELKTPLAYVRSEKKEHGKTSIVEGEIKPGFKAVIVDDVATTGKSIRSAAEILRSYSLIVEDAVVAVDRREGAEELLKSLGIKLHYIISTPQMFKFLREYGVETP